MRRYWMGLIVAAGFVALGAATGWLMARGTLPNPQASLNLSADLAGMASRAGLLLGLAALAATGVWLLVDRRVEAARRRERQAQGEARQQFLRRLDHELKNPLTILRLALVNLAQSSNPNPKQSSSLARIEQQVQRLQKLVMDLRLLTELDQRSLERKPFDLKALLDETIALACETAEPPREVTLSVQQTPWPVSSVTGDRDLLLLAFRNLLDNALKFTPPEGRVEMRLSEDGRTAIVEVADTGMGIPPEEIPLIFEELYRGQNARGISGSGLGLKLVERIVALHAGTVAVRSKPGQGTVFTVRLPLGE